MNKKIISIALSMSLTATMCGGLASTASAAEAKTPQYQTNARQMEELNRGLIAAYRVQDSQNVTETGVYLSWRLLGDEPLETQEFDIYKNGVKLTTTTGAKGTNYVDISGTATDKYKVVKAGASAAEVAAEEEVTPAENHVAGNSQYTNLANSFTYMDIPIERPDPVDKVGGGTSYYYTTDNKHEGGANDASVGDLDGDGDYELVLKWDPYDSKDAASNGNTGRVFIDAYEIDPDNTAEKNGGHLYKWRIDLGYNIRAGAHDTQFMVYDFDGDGDAEIAMVTAPGTIDGTGEYVSKVGDTEEIRTVDNTAINLSSRGKNNGPEYYTIFDGETGKALYTTDAIPKGDENGSIWGDSKENRAFRYLAAVAYIDGVHPSYIACRGYYNRAVIRAYTWDGTELTLQWEHTGDKKGTTMYGEGNHNLSVGDIDNDGKDEIVYGSAALDDDGKTILGNTQLGHGDAMHMNDFNNDGILEVFSVKEDSEGWYNKYAEDLRVAKTGEHFWEAGKICWTTKLNPDTNKAWDNGRGVMDNIDDAYAKSEYDKGNKNVMALGWSSGFPNTHDFNGDDVATKPAAAGNGSFDNSLIYWDGDLGRELLDANIIQKYNAADGTTKRFWGESDGYTLTGGSTNNYTKRNASLSADLWGDWREEIIMPVGKGESDTPLLRIYTSTIPTDYRLTTLMHDCQYRLSIAWQNVGYNQPPHTSYYVGSVALATDASGNELNYLAPAVPYTKVTYDLPAAVAVTGVTLSESEVSVEKGKTVTVNATITPADATKKGIIWTSSDTNVATVANGVIKGVGEGTATITATTKDGGFTAECTVNVYATNVTGITLSDKVIELGMDNSKTLTAYVKPDDATDKTVTWTSADPAVASVSSDGTVTGLSFGKTTVTATTADGGKTAECIVKVKPMSIVEATGEGLFESANTDEETTVTATAVSGGLSQNFAKTDGEVHKDFEVYSKNKATLEFRLTTGGQKGITGDGNWNWTGYEYTMGIKFLDENGDNILNIYQPYSTKATDLMSAVADNEAAAVTKSGWTNSGNVSGNIQGSSKRWKVKAEFDYDNDLCTVQVVGTGSDWVTDDGVMQRTFSLNGANFKTLSLYTINQGDGGIKATPLIENVSYTTTEAVYGNTEVVYERGSATEWSDADLTDWVQTGTETAALALDSENGRIWYNPTNPSGEYSATKTFDGFSEDAFITYDVDWYFGNATGRTSVLEYIQFGDNLRIGYTSGYYTLVSADAGTTYDGLTDGAVDPEKSIFTGEKDGLYTKNVKVIFDKKANTIKSLTFDGKVIDAYTNYKLPDGAVIDSVSFGLQRGGGTSNWNYPNGIDRIRVSQFIAGEEEPDFSAVKITEAEGTTVNLSYDLVDYNGGSIQLIGALYDDDDKLVEVKSTEVMDLDDSIQHIRQGTDSLTFAKNVADYKVKVFMWDSLNGMTPIGDMAEREKSSQV